MNLFWTVSEVFCYSVWIIIITLSIYWNIRLRAENSEMYITKRNVSSFYALNLSLILLMISLLFMAITLVHYSSIGLSISSSFAIGFVWSTLFFLITKNWMMFYKNKYTYYVMQTQWQQLINHNVVDMNNGNNNWYIVNHNKYDNLSYVYKLCSVFAVIGWLLGVIGCHFLILSNYDLYWSIIGALLYLIATAPAIIIYIIIRRHTPFVDDTYDIHWESKLHTKLLIIFPVCLTITNICFLVTKIFSVYLFGLFAMSLCIFSMLYISVVLLPNKQMELRQIASESINIDRDITLNEILTDQKSVHLFMVYLSKEYSMEVLLSYIEFVQFQQYLFPHIDNAEILNKVKTIDFPSNIPISEIIESDDHDGVYKSNSFLSGAKIKAHKIHKKYIESGFNEFEINISGQERDKLTELLSDLDELLLYDIDLTDLFLLFQSCKQEMSMLLTISLSRFKLEDEFKNIVSLHQHSKEKYVD